MKKPETYRDLDYNEVVSYANKKGLNTNTPENWREAAIRMFDEKYGKRETPTIKAKKCKGCGYSIALCICQHTD